jgi:hypothetical protein
MEYSTSSPRPFRPQVLDLIYMFLPLQYPLESSDRTQTFIPMLSLPTVRVCARIHPASSRLWTAIHDSSLRWPPSIPTHPPLLTRRRWVSCTKEGWKKRKNGRRKKRGKVRLTFWGSYQQVIWTTAHGVPFPPLFQQDALRTVIFCPDNIIDPERPAPCFPRGLPPELTARRKRAREKMSFSQTNASVRIHRSPGLCFFFFFGENTKKGWKEWPDTASITRL